MFILGVSFALGLNILIFFEGITGSIIRAIIGIIYIVISGYIIKHALYYKRYMKETYMLCQHCAQKGEVPDSLR
jgi:uncharacterized membrane protein